MEVHMAGPEKINAKWAVGRGGNVVSLNTLFTHRAIVEPEGNESPLALQWEHCCFFFAGYTLISSCSYERVDVHARWS